MTQKKTDATGLLPDSIRGNLESSIRAADWLQVSDRGALALARRLATALDVAFDMGELKDVPGLAGRLIGVLQQLHLTTETRTQGKQKDENDGTGYVGDYLRLLKAEDSKSESGSTKRRAGSKPTS
jgi:hypothetical protein